MSVSLPTLRAKSSVPSKIGGRISPKPKVPKTSRAVCSTRFHSEVSGGSRSRVPRMAWNLRGFSPFLAAPSLTPNAPLPPKLSFRAEKADVFSFRFAPAKRSAFVARNLSAQCSASSREESLATRHFFSVDVLIPDVPLRIRENRSLIDTRERALHFSRRAHHQAARGNRGALRNQRPRRDDAARANRHAIQNHRAYAAQASRLDGAAVQRHG